ncbi:plasma membrane ascorbate-dependent reductase CYBRD1 [Bacillus rossius redtenbacheri]|uniref:plasma membrane ascorbate-dependent reductase CYBRD1 n=1 Tax=Bacillus rossius redtenbacheri TaxID=93214 RepID=UPI002FDE4312
MDTSERNLDGLMLAFSASEVLGALAVTMVTVWVGHYRGGFAWSSDPGIEFNWHPVLMTTAMIFLYGNSIMVYRAFRNSRKRRLKLIHMALHLVAFILTVVALQAAFDSHNLKTPPTPNLYTLHSWLGLMAVIMYAAQWVSGFIAFLFPGIQTNLRASLLPIHTFFGLMGFVCAVAAALMGLTEKANFAVVNYQDLPAEGIFINCIGVVMVGFATLVMYIVTEQRFKRLPRPEDEILLTGGSE